MPVNTLHHPLLRFLTHNDSHTPFSPNAACHCFARAKAVRALL